MASPKSKNKPLWTPEQRKKFRHDVAQLKRKGLISKQVDARKALPTRNLKKAIKVFDDVLKGEARVFRVPRKFAKSYFDLGYKVKNNRIVVSKEQYVPSRGKSAHIVKTRKGIFTIWDFPQRPDDFEEFIDFMQERGFDKLGPGEVYGFKFFGWNSRRTFSTLEDLLQFLHDYNAIERAYGNPNYMSECLQNFSLVKTNFATYRGAEDNIARAKKIRRDNVKVYRMREGKKSRRYEPSPVQAERNRERDAEWHRRHYDKDKARERKRAARAKEAAKYVKWWE